MVKKTIAWNITKNNLH